MREREVEGCLTPKDFFKYASLPTVCRERIKKNSGLSITVDFLESPSQKNRSGASLVAQWLGVCLLMQGTRVRALVWEDPTCRGAAGPVSHNC